MTANVEPRFVTAPASPAVSLSNTTSTTLYSAAPADGAYVGNIWHFATSTLSGAGNLELYINNGATDFLIGARPLAASQAGELLDGVYFPATIRLAAGYSLKAKLSAISAGSVTVAVTQGGGYTA